MEKRRGRVGEVGEMEENKFCQQVHILYFYRDSFPLEKLLRIKSQLIFFNVVRRYSLQERITRHNRKELLGTCTVHRSLISNELKIK